jgi:hypothetical protein
MERIGFPKRSCNKGINCYYFLFETDVAFVNLDLQTGLDGKHKFYFDLRVVILQAICLDTNPLIRSNYEEYRKRETSIDSAFRQIKGRRIKDILNDPDVQTI